MSPRHISPVSAAYHPGGSRMRTFQKSARRLVCSLCLLLVLHGPAVICRASSSSNGNPPPPPPSSSSSASDYDYYHPRTPPATTTTSTASTYTSEEPTSSSYPQGYYDYDSPPFPPETDLGARPSYYGQGYPSNDRPPPPPPLDRRKDYGADDQSSFPGSREEEKAETWKTPVPKAPIHYEFPAAANDEGDYREDEDAQRTREEEGDLRPAKASARTDLVTQYMSTTTGKLKVWTTSTILGGSTGIFLSKSVLPLGSELWWGVLFALVFGGSSTFLRTPLGELTRALALSILLVLERSSRIRKTYPTWPYILPALAGSGGSPRRRRRPFPPARNPWKYAPRRPEDAEFNMLYTLVAMALVGSTCGGNLPMVPTWIGSLSGAAIFAYTCTLTGKPNSGGNPRGDLFRTMGMRVVAMCQELWEIQAQLGIIPKAAVVSGQVIDRLMILDKQHKVKDRFLSLINAGYDRAMQTARQIQEQRLDSQGRGTSSGDPPSRRDYDEDRSPGRGRSSPFPRDERDREGRRGRGRRYDEEEDRRSSRSNDWDRQDRRDSRGMDRRPRGSNERGMGEETRDPANDNGRRQFPGDEEGDWRSKDDYASEKDSALSDKKRGWFRR